MIESVYNLPLDPLIALYSAVPSQVTGDKTSFFESRTFFKKRNKIVLALQRTNRANDR